jgi:hypothetical protein
MLYEIRQYTDEEGKAVTARVPIDSKTLGIHPTEPIKFFGIYTIPGMNMRVQFDFPVGYSVEQCFEEFKQVAEKHYEQLQQEIQKEASTPNLWTPGDPQGGGKKGLFIPK